MKFVFLLFAFLLAFLAFPCAGKCQQKLDRVNPNRDPNRSGLRNLDRQRTVIQGKTLDINAHFNFTRAVFPVDGSDMLTRTASYVVPILATRSLGQNWSLEAGPFAGINRYSYQNSYLLQSNEAPAVSENYLTYGVMLGISRKLTDRLSFQFRYRKDLCGQVNAWQPLQLGWSFKF